MFGRLKMIDSKLKRCCLFCLLLIVICVCSLFSFSKYSSSVSSSQKSVSIAKPVVKLENDVSSTDIVDGTGIVKYFTISNYDVDDITDVGVDYYIYVVNENDELITDANIYYQLEEDNPNEFGLVNKITEGEYKGYFEAMTFTTDKQQHSYKLVVDNISGYNKIYVKVIAIQKEVSS